MKKAKVLTSFVCQECGYDTPSWFGKCPECGTWNSLKEFKTAKPSTSSVSSGVSFENKKPQSLKEIAYEERSRIQTEYDELNTVLGGGIVRGSVILIAGDPGVGKSTLLLQLALSLASDNSARGSVSRYPTPTSSAVLQPTGARAGVPTTATSRSKTTTVLYISGEESVEQVKMRAMRVLQQEGSQKKSDPTHDNLLLVSMTDADAIVTQIETIKPDLVIVDSIQTIESQNISGLSGSVAQVRYSALQFVRVAKQYNIPIVIVGHVTKEGMVAGPMVLSHMVDTVLFLEGERFAKTRILRSLKNRFGPVDEVGIFLMEGEGMVEAKNPEQLFLESKNIETPGSILVSTLEGSRAFLVELQALVVSTRLPMPRRVVSGMDQRRVELLLAVLQKHCRLPVDTMDVFVNVAGGLKLADPGIDLGVCLAVISSLHNKSFGSLVGIAEVGLLGELRVVNGLEKRVREAKKLGFKNVITAKTHKTLREVLGELGKMRN
ncbi:MAG: AAA family ATPase [Patescibacteria group bacterium]